MASSSIAFILKKSNLDNLRFFPFSSCLKRSKSGVRFSLFSCLDYGRRPSHSFFFFVYLIAHAGSPTVCRFAMVLIHKNREPVSTTAVSTRLSTRALNCIYTLDVHAAVLFDTTALQDVRFRAGRTQPQHNPRTDRAHSYHMASVPVMANR